MPLSARERTCHRNGCKEEIFLLMDNNYWLCESCYRELLTADYEIDDFIHFPMHGRGRRWINLYRVYVGRPLRRFTGEFGDYIGDCK